MLNLIILKQLLEYNPDTGIFTWKIDRKGKAIKGSVAGWYSGEYQAISIFGNRYYSHKLAYFYMTGIWPLFEIDHINRITTDNRWSNLRLATHKQNMENVSLRKDNTSGIKGVCWNKIAGKWNAFINVNGKRKHLGYFDNIDDASSARRCAENIHYTHSY